MLRLVGQNENSFNSSLRTLDIADNASRYRSMKSYRSYVSSVLPFFTLTLEEFVETTHSRKIRVKSHCKSLVVFERWFALIGLSVDYFFKICSFVESIHSFNLELIKIQKSIKNSKIVVLHVVISICKG